MAIKNLPAAITQVTGVFDPINFNALNKAISKLASSKGTLSPDEKKFAIDIIDEWDHDVIKAIDDKIQEGHQIMVSLDPNNHYVSVDDDVLSTLAKQLGKKVATLYKNYVTAKNKVLEISKERPSYDRTRDIDETSGEYLDRVAKEDAEYGKYELRLAKAKNKEDWALFELKREMAETPEVQEITRRIRGFCRKSNTFKKDCNEKSRLAKINVTISDETVRDALKEILDFNI